MKNSSTLTRRAQRASVLLIRAVGNSMLGDGIRHGETLSALPVDTIEEGRIAVFSTPLGLTLKRGYSADDGAVILRSSNPTYPDQRWRADQVRVVAVVNQPELSARWN